MKFYCCVEVKSQNGSFTKIKLHETEKKAFAYGKRQSKKYTNSHWWVNFRVFSENRYDN